MIEKIDLVRIEQIAKEAGGAAMRIYEKDFTVAYKEDSSPLTEADTAANAIICDALQSLYPDIPILSEENSAVAYDVRREWDYFWCIDPIDGTKEFIKKNGEFTINIALIHKDTPVLGVVYAPVLEELYSAKEGAGAFKNGVALPLTRNDNDYIVVASRSHLNDETKAFIDAIRTDKEKRFHSRGSSLKLCMVAEGAADIYPRLAPTMEWDTAAADAVVRAAGKMTRRYDDNTPLRYNKRELRNPWFVVS